MQCLRKLGKDYWNNFTAKVISKNSLTLSDQLSDLDSGSVTKVKEKNNKKRKSGR